jgi:3-hydroxybutyryl-CoA dehydratase
MHVTRATPTRCLTFDDLNVGDEVTEQRHFTQDMITAFAAISLDTAPVHEDPAYARSMGLETNIVQGLLVSSPFSRLLGMYLPGERTLLEKLTFKFRQPVFCDTQLLYHARIERLRPPLKIVQLSLRVTCGDIEHVVGEAQCHLKPLA